jgi:aromatic ring-cleaving dioxygenase
MILKVPWAEENYCVCAMHVHCVVGPDVANLGQRSLWIGDDELGLHASHRKVAAGLSEQVPNNVHGVWVCL